MDLNSLPDEMLTNVLKFTVLEKIRELRKLNKRIDRLARRAHLSTQVDVEKIRFTSTSHAVYPMSKKFDSYTYYSHNVSDPDNDLCANVNKWLPKMKIHKTLVFSDNVVIDEKVVDVMKRHRASLRNTICLCLRGVDFCIKTNNMCNKLFNELCPSLSTMIIRNVKENNGTILNTEVLGRKMWKQLTIQSATAHLDDAFLDIGPNCKILELFLDKSGVTVKGVLNMLKKCWAAESFDHYFDIAFVLLGDLQFQDIENLFVSNLPGIQIECYGMHYMQPVFVMRINYGLEHNFKCRMVVELNPIQ